MTRLLHIEGKEIVEVTSDISGAIELLDGDVYVFDEGNTMYIWIGKDAAVEEGTVAAWVVNKIDTEERGGAPDVFTINQGEEPEEFKYELNVIDGDTPGFLRKAELDMVEYALYRVYLDTDTKDFDKAKVEKVPLERASLNSGDVFVLDGNENIYCWIGSGADLEEKFHGQKLMQKIDSERHYIPLQFTIYEGEGGKSEAAFYDFLEKAKGVGKVLSVEDQREATYRPEGEKTSAQQSGKKKGFWARLFGK